MAVPFPRATALLMVFMLVGCSASVARKGVTSVRLVSPQGSVVKLNVEVAADKISQEKGLMGRKSLPRGEGMLFVFPGMQKRYFWMKNTLIPLDILFFDDAGRIVSMNSMQPCISKGSSASCPLTSSRGDAKFVIEVAKGSIAQFKITKEWVLALGDWVRN